MSEYNWNNHIRKYTTRSGAEKAYTVPRLWELSKDFPVVEMCPDDVPKLGQILDHQAKDIWGKRRDTDPEFTMRDFWAHAKRVQEADLEYPVILDPEGGVLDGMHRIMKAKLEGVSVRAVQFEEWPEPDLEW